MGKLADVFLGRAPSMILDPEGKPWLLQTGIRARAFTLREFNNPEDADSFILFMKGDHEDTPETAGIGLAVKISRVGLATLASDFAHDAAGSEGPTGDFLADLTALIKAEQLRRGLSDIDVARKLDLIADAAMAKVPRAW